MVIGYRSDEKVMLGLYVLLAYFYFLVSEVDVHLDRMNEPHYLLDINIWAKTVKKVMFAIRSAGCDSSSIGWPRPDSPVQL
jgi:hypothetical protein